MIIKITQDHLELLEHHKISLHSSGDAATGWLRIGASYNTTGTAWLEPYSACLAGPRLCSIGSFSYSKS